MGETPEDITIGIFGVGDLGRKICSLACDPANDSDAFKRIKRILLKGRGYPSQNVKTYIDNVVAAQNEQRKSQKLHEIVVEEADAITVAQDSNIAYICLETRYSKDKYPSPYWENSPRMKLFNSNCAAILEYADIFKQCNSQALVVSLTNPMILGHFFRVYSEIGLDQLVAITTDTMRANRTLEKYIPLLKENRIRHFGDHGENSCLALDSLEGTNEISDADKEKMRIKAGEISEDLMRAFGSTSDEVVIQLGDFLQSVLANTGKEYVFGANYHFTDGENSGDIISQVPLRIVEKSRGVFRSEICEDVMRKYRTDANHQKIQSRILAEIRDIEKSDPKRNKKNLEYAVKHGRPLVQYLDKTYLHLLDQRDLNYCVELECSSQPMFVESLKSRVAAFTMKNDILLWKLPDLKPIKAAIKPEDNCEAFALCHDGCSVAYSSPSFEGSCLAYFNANFDSKTLVKGPEKDISFIPSAMAINDNDAKEKRLYCANKQRGGSAIRVFRLDDLEEIGLYPSVECDGEAISSIIPVQGKFQKSKEYLFAKTKNYVICWENAGNGKDSAKRIVFTEKCPDCLFTAGYDRWNNVMMFFGKGTDLCIEAIKDGNRVQMNTQKLRAVMGNSFAFDPVDNYLYVGSKNAVYSYPYWRNKLLIETDLSRVIEFKGKELPDGKKESAGKGYAVRAVLCK